MIDIITQNVIYIFFSQASRYTYDVKANPVPVLVNCTYAENKKLYSSNGCACLEGCNGKQTYVSHLAELQWRLETRRRDVVLTATPSKFASRPRDVSNVHVALGPGAVHQVLTHSRMSRFTCCLRVSCTRTY